MRWVGVHTLPRHEVLHGNVVIGARHYSEQPMPLTGHYQRVGVHLIIDTQAKDIVADALIILGMIMLPLT